MQIYQQDFNNFFCAERLKSILDAAKRIFIKKDDFVKKIGRFNLKVALFAEKGKNKFAYEYNWNNFVFNNDIYV